MVNSGHGKEKSSQEESTRQEGAAEEVRQKGRTEKTYKKGGAEENREESGRKGRGTQQEGCAGEDATGQALWYGTRRCRADFGRTRGDWRPVGRRAGPVETRIRGFGER